MYVNYVAMYIYNYNTTQMLWYKHEHSTNWYKFGYSQVQSKQLMGKRNAVWLLA